MTNETILLIDDESGVLVGQENLLNVHGFENVLCAATAADAREYLQERSVNLALVDLNLGDSSGFELMRWIREYSPETEMIVVTAASDVKSAVESMKLGASDYLIKGVDTERFIPAIERVLAQLNARKEVRAIRNAFLRDELQNPEAFKDFVTRSRHIQRIFVYLEAVAPLPDPVLMTGETGVGKEVVARAIHHASGAEGEFVPVNLGGLDDQAISDTLFGHVKGAYTGAHTNRAGLIKSATKGTLFVDEFAEISTESQVKLLRLLDSGEFYALGSDRIRSAQTRFVFATNLDLDEAIERGTFRRDLYFRISNHHIHIPPLRERQEDIEPILMALLDRDAKRIGREGPEVGAAALDSIRSLPLPGNVRELQRIALTAILTGSWDHVVHDSVHSRVNGSSPTEPPQLTRPALASETGTPSRSNSVDETITFGSRLPTPVEAVEKLLREADRRYPNNRSEAAESIGLSPQAFANRWRRMSEDDKNSTGSS